MMSQIVYTSFIVVRGSDKRSSTTLSSTYVLEVGHHIGKFIIVTNGRASDFGLWGVVAKRSAETIDVWDIVEGGVISWEAERTCVEAPASDLIAGFVFGPNRDLVDDLSESSDGVHFPPFLVDTRSPRAKREDMLSGTRPQLTGPSVGRAASAATEIEGVFITRGMAWNCLGILWNA